MSGPRQPFWPGARERAGSWHVPLAPAPHQCDVRCAARAAGRGEPAQCPSDAAARAGPGVSCRDGRAHRPLSAGRRAAGPGRPGRGGRGTHGGDVARVEVRRLLQEGQPGVRVHHVLRTGAAVSAGPGATAVCRGRAWASGPAWSASSQPHCGLRGAVSDRRLQPVSHPGPRTRPAPEVTAVTPSHSTVTGHRHVRTDVRSTRNRNSLP